MGLQNYYQGLCSKRFTYRKLTYGDINSWMEFFINNSNLKYLGIDLNRTPQAMAKAWIDTQMERYEKQEFGQLGIILKKPEVLIGTIGFMIKEGCKKGEIVKATAIKPAFWSKGIGMEAAITVINAVFENNLAETIIGFRHINNIASQHHNRSLGFKDIESVNVGKRLVMKYGLSRQSWEQKQDYYYPDSSVLSLS